MEKRIRASTGCEIGSARARFSYRLSYSEGHRPMCYDFIVEDLRPKSARCGWLHDRMDSDGCPLQSMKASAGVNSSSCASATGLQVILPSQILRPLRKWMSSLKARRQPLSASCKVKGRVALLSAKVDVRATAPGYWLRIMHHTIDHKGRIGMCRRPRRFGTAALVDGYVDENGALLHSL